MKVNCGEHRDMMKLLGLKEKLKNNTLEIDEKKMLETEINKLEKDLGID